MSELPKEIWAAHTIGSISGTSCIMNASNTKERGYTKYIRADLVEVDPYDLKMGLKDWLKENSSKIDPQTGLPTGNRVKSHSVVLARYIDYLVEQGIIKGK